MGRCRRPKKKLKFAQEKDSAGGGLRQKKKARRKRNSRAAHVLENFHRKGLLGGKCKRSGHTIEYGAGGTFNEPKPNSESITENNDIS